jgi:predicted phage-related endonuclease
MPDRSFETVSASQAPALFNHSPYMTRWILWHAFRARDLRLIEPPESERMHSGKLLQRVILAETADHFKLEVQENIEDRYDRAGQLGCTIDAHLIVPDQGEIIVEAKNVDWLRWRDTWTETAAPIHIEIQMQQQLLVRNCPRGAIACFVGGNQFLWYEREAMPEWHARLKEEAALFFESLAKNDEPDPIGSPLSLPLLAKLYPESDPAEIIEATDDDDLGDTIRQFEWAREQATFATRLQEQMKAKILTRAGSAGIIKAPGATAYITKSPIAEGVCAPHAEPKVTRKASIQTRIKVTKESPHE